MIDLSISYQEAGALLQFLDIKVELVGKKEPDIVNVRNKLIGEIDNYQQLLKMLPTEEKQKQQADKYLMGEISSNTQNCTIEVDKEGLFYWCYGCCINSIDEVDETYTNPLEALIGLCKWLEDCVQKSDQLINDVFERAESIA